MTSPERRSQPRTPCDFRAELYILLPEETFRPVPHMVTVLDVSSGGARVRCPNLTPEEQSQISEDTHYARLQVRQEKGTDRLYCKIAWIQEVAPDGERRVFDLGLTFEVRHPADEQAATSILDRAMKNPRRYSSPPSSSTPRGPQ